MSRFRSRLACVLICSLIPSTIPASAQQPTLRSEATNVVLDVVVTQKGKPVPGIDRSRFHILENNREQTIASLEEHTPAASVPAKLHPLPPHTYNNLPAYPSTGTLNVLLLDGLNTPLGNQVEVRKKMLKHLATVRPGTVMAIFALSSKLRMIQGFTTDSSALVAALGKAQANPSQSPQLGDVTNSAFDSITSSLNLIHAGAADLNMVQSFQTDVQVAQDDRRVQMTIQAMQQIARFLNGLPGRKNLIWFSSSFPIVLDTGSASFSRVPNSYAEQLRTTTDLLAAARVAVYPVDPAGVATPVTFDVKNDGLNPPPTDPTYDAHFTAEEIAAQTGGQAFFNNNDFGLAVDNAIQNGSAYYTLAYTPTAKDFHGEFRKFKVRVDGCDCQLAYRPGYYAEPAGKTPSQTAALITGATQHGAPPSTGMLFQARVLPSTDPAVADAHLPATPLGDAGATLKQPTRRFVADIVVDARTLQLPSLPDGSRQLALDFALIAYDAEGHRVNSLDRNLKAVLPANKIAQILASGAPVRMAIDVPAAPASLVIAVHDALSSRVGSLEIALTGTTE